MTKPQPISVTVDFGDGRLPITIETGVLAKQADGSVVVKQGKTRILATVVSAKEPKKDVDFMPLSVDYQEKFASFGRFPGGFIKREGKPSDYEILTARLVDRALRPLFPKDYHAETFVTVQLISADKDIMPDSLAGLAASAAITISDVPFDGPMAEVRVARVNGEFIINPSFEENEKADIDIMIGGTLEHIVMIEGEMDEVSEDDMIEAMKVGHEAIKKLCEAQLELQQKAGKPKREYPGDPEDEELEKIVIEKTSDKIYEVVKMAIKDKHKRKEEFNKIKEALIEELVEDEEDTEKIWLIDKYFTDNMKRIIRKVILDEGVRLDGRKLDEIRPIWCEVDYLPSAHGSAIFTRGETQSLSTVTLGSKLDEQVIDEVLLQSTERFILHYNFPPFSTNDPRPQRGVSRREIGHGNLALRALKRMIPPEEEFPYTIRVVSDILESNGSSSMATVCAGTLALMDAGIKIKKPVSGIAMGLITDEETGKWAVLSDILGDEDHYGDMDFKVTGTRDGITACQMDIKVKGLSYEILSKALEQARQGRLFILDKMLETLSEPRPSLKPHAPKIKIVRIPAVMIGALIGPGGRIIQKIQEETDTTIVIEPEEKEGIVHITATSDEGMEEALKRIREITAIPEVGEIYKGTVKKIEDKYVIVEVMPGRDGLLHISEISDAYIADISRIMEVGDKINVKVIEYDKETGRFKLSTKGVQEFDIPPNWYRNSGNSNHRHSNDTYHHRHNPEHKHDSRYENRQDNRQDNRHENKFGNRKPFNRRF